MTIFSKSVGRYLLFPFFTGVAVLMLTGVTFAQLDETPAAEGSAAADGADEGSTAPPTAEQISPEQVQQMLTDGQKALASGDLKTALDIFDKLAGAAQRSSEPQARFILLPDLLTYRALALSGMKEYDLALEDLNEAIEINRDLEQALVARGQLYLAMGDPGSALPDFQNAVRINRTNLFAQFGLGKAYVLLGGAQQAIKPLTRALAADPKNQEAYRLRGSAYAGIGDPIKATADLQEALSLNPKDFEAYFTLASVNMGEEDYQEALSNFSQSIENYVPPPELEGQPFVQGHLSKAMASIELGKDIEGDEAKKAAYQAAADECELLLKQLDEKDPNTRGPRAATLFGLGIAQRMLGELDKAIASLSAAIEINPEMGEAIFRRGICFHLIDEDKMAISDFKHAANIMFEDPRPTLWEGFLYSKIGDYHEAIRAFGDALAASDRYVPAHVNRGLAYMMLGKYQKAVDDFNEAIRLEPTRASHYFKRGIAYAELGEHEKASSSFANAIEHDEKHAPSYRRMAQTMQALGHSELAREYLQKAASLAPPETPAQAQ